MIYTQNYRFPQYEENDVTSYLTTYNNTMEQIDTAIHNNETSIIKNTTDIETLENQQSTTDANVTDINNRLADVEIASQGHTARLNGIDQSITAIQGDIANINTELGTIADIAGKVYNGVLSAGETTLAITIGDFDDNTLVDVYVSQYGIAPLTIELREATGGQPNLCVMTFDEQQSDLRVAVVTKGVN